LSVIYHRNIRGSNIIQFAISGVAAVDKPVSTKVVCGVTKLYITNYAPIQTGTKYRENRITDVEKTRRKSVCGALADVW
jgi:hypothetical protein